MMTNTTKVLHQSIGDVGSGLRRGEISAVEIVQACLQRIDALNPELNAFITILRDEAVEQARVAESEIRAGKWLGPLHGVPVGVKDFYDTAGIRTTAAFEHFKDRVPAKDAVSVATLKRAGAIVIGKMNMHQLGTGTTGLEGFFGPARNPWNSEYIPGGASSGSAVAVASGMCYATLDTDAVGSCRLPAACCGVVGFKGTYGLISGKGILEGEPVEEMILWLAHGAITTRSVRDTALVLEVLAMRNKHNKDVAYADCIESRRTLRVGVGEGFQADEQVRASFEEALEVVGRLGWPMSRASVPKGDIEGLSNGTADIESDRRGIAERAYRDIDVLLLPTTTTIVPSIQSVGVDPRALSPDNTAFANYFGLPAISVPCGFDRNGLPIGLQMVAKPWDEEAVLLLAARYEEAAAWSQKRPLR